MKYDLPVIAENAGLTEERTARIILGQLDPKKGLVDSMIPWAQRNERMHEAQAVLAKSEKK